MTKSKFAALTAGLLARKGEAIPSAHSAFIQASAWAEAAQPHPRPVQKTAPPQDLAGLIERAPHPAPASPPAQPRAPQAVRDALPQGPSFGLRGRAVAAPHAPRSGLASASGPAWSAIQRLHRTAVTVRLDDMRYLRLRLTQIRFQRTYQDILTRALDAYLTALGVEQIDEGNAEQWRSHSVRPASG